MIRYLMNKNYKSYGIPHASAVANKRESYPSFSSASIELFPKNRFWSKAIEKQEENELPQLKKRQNMNDIFLKSSKMVINNDAAKKNSFHYAAPLTVLLTSYNIMDILKKIFHYFI